PILPGLITKLTHGNFSAASEYYGWFMAIFGAMQFLFAPILGGLSDRYGRRPILLLSMFFGGIDYVIMALAPNVWWLFLGRTLSGMTGASFTAATAYIADVSPPEKRAQNFGLIGAAFGIGFIIGPALGGLLGTIGLRVPFIAAAALSLVNWLYGFFILPESLAAENRRSIGMRDANPFRAIHLLRRYPLVLALTTSTVCVSLGQQALQSTWVLYNSVRFHWSAEENGLSLAAVGLVAGAVQAGLMRFLVPRFGERRLVVVGLAGNALGLALYGMATRGWMMYAVLGVWGFAFVGGPAMQSLISTHYGPDEQGAVQGALSSLNSLTGIVGPVICTSLFAYFISSAAPIRVPGIAFFFGAALAFSGLLLAIQAFGKNPVPEIGGPR
ncbi:MAG: TCR/Tet family MFS transporter, partial [Chloroflexi bacterium]|nr:TCR/Tet family MFS transporter [Chloroflexota bacterium]